MILSKACEYGVRAMLYLASAPRDTYVASRAVSEDLGLPYSFFAKVVQTLAHSGLLSSQRGPSGGVALAKDPSEVTLAEVVTAIDGETLFTECVLGLPGCGQEKPCPLHAQWTFTRTHISAFFQTATIASLMEDGDYRLGSLFSAPEE
ncbi:MAG: Rrf2 family transcriptional regulator [Bacteroidota bacterium]